MPKKIESPLREGLPSKIYLLAYGEPLTAYEMAKRIYGIKPPEPGARAQIPATSKVSTWVKKMKERLILSENKEGKTFSKVEPLVDEIERTLKENKIELSNLEKHMVHRLLDSKEFRSLVKNMELRLGHYDGPTWISHDIDSAWLIMNILATSVAIIGLRRKIKEIKAEILQPVIPKEFEKLDFVKRMQETKEYKELAKIERFPQERSKFDKRLDILKRFWETKEFEEFARAMTKLLKQVKDTEVYEDRSNQEFLEIFRLTLLLRSIPTSTLEKLVNLSFINRLVMMPYSAGLDFFPFSRLEKVLGKEVGRMKTRKEKKLSKVPEWKKRRMRRF